MPPAAVFKTVTVGLLVTLGPGLQSCQTLAVVQDQIVIGWGRFFVLELTKRG